MESNMISSPVYPGRPARRRALATTIAIGLIATSAVLGLVVAGVTFGALAIAFEIAVPIAQQYDVSVSAADMAMAARLADFWWVFGTLSVASFLGAGVVTVKAIAHLDSAPRD
jgi:uncharacterized oligopeptide transporter (OPT) family protein